MAAKDRPARGRGKEEAPTKGKEEANPKLEALKEVAETLNAVLGLDPAIDPDLEEAELEKALKQEATLIGVNSKTDKVEQAVIDADKKALEAKQGGIWAWLEEGGYLAHLVPEPAKTDDKGKGKDSGKGKDAGKGKDSGKGKDAGKGKDSGKSPAAPRYTRANAFADAIDSGETNVDKIIALSNDNYVKKGNGSDNLKEAKWYYGTIVPGLIALGFATLDGDKLIVIEVPKK